MITSLNGIHFIEEVEGNILYAYDDYNEKRVPVGGTAKGTITIGVGHTTAAGPPVVVPGMTITAEESDRILANDLKRVEVVVNEVFPNVSQNVYDGAVSFAFNCGNKALKTASWVAAYKAGNMADAEQRLMLWNKAGGKVVGGLINRRRREADLIFRGKYNLKKTKATNQTTPKPTPQPQTQETVLRKTWLQALIEFITNLFRRK